MPNFWESMILNTALGILSGLKRNPLVNPEVRTILLHIQQDVGEILDTSTPATPPTT